jgi:hypothetical protein
MSSNTWAPASRSTPGLVSGFIVDGIAEFSEHLDEHPIDERLAVDEDAIAVEDDQIDLQRRPPVR